MPLLQVVVLDRARAASSCSSSIVIARRGVPAPNGRWRRRRREAEARRAGGRTRRRRAQLLGEADALAAAGRFSEAARLLLFRSIEDIDARRPDLVRPALTSRDIAALPAIPDRPRSAFAADRDDGRAQPVRARPLAADDWRDCRAAYEEFAFAEGWRG